MPEHNGTDSPVSQPLIQHRDNAPNVPTYQLREAVAEILMVITRYPELTDFGFGVWDERSRRLSPVEREAEFQINRAKMFEERSLRQFLHARDWLQEQQKRKTINQWGTSYGLKHVAAHDVGYITNGVFIAAAVSAGFQIERSGTRQQSPNAYMNIATRAWRRPRPRVVGRRRRWS
jgi:hypothetical protein